MWAGLPEPVIFDFPAPGKFRAIKGFLSEWHACKVKQKNRKEGRENKSLLVKGLKYLFFRQRKGTAWIRFWSRFWAGSVFVWKEYRYGSKTLFIKWKIFVENQPYDVKIKSTCYILILSFTFCFWIINTNKFGRIRIQKFYSTIYIHMSHRIIDDRMEKYGNENFAAILCRSIVRGGGAGTTLAHPPR